MAKLFERLFGWAKKAKQPPQTAYDSFAEYDAEYIAYCIEQEQVVSGLEEKLHTSDDPEEIATQTLKAACRFYGADWAGIIEVDLDLGLWTPGWWYSPNPHIKTIDKIQGYENAMFMPSWINAMQRNEPIVVLDTGGLEKTSPQEHQMYQRLKANSVIAVPFGPNPVGFLAVRNPTRYRTLVSTMSILAYVLHRAMAQQKTIERAKMALSPDRIQTDRDIIVNLFGGMEIRTKGGIWREHDFNSPKSSRAIAYILLHRKTAHSALAIADALYPEDNSDADTINKNVRGYIYRFRKSFEPISDYKLIEYMANGYRVNSVLHVMTDLEQFEGLWEQAQKDIPIPTKVNLLKSAIALYKGSVFESACGDHWLTGIATEYRMKYIGMVNELLSILAQSGDYDSVHHFALTSLKLVPENVKAHYWLVYSMFHSGTVELARTALQQAKMVLTEEEFFVLKRFIAKDETLCRGQLFEE